MSRKYLAFTQYLKESDSGALGMVSRESVIRCVHLLLRYILPKIIEIYTVGINLLQMLIVDSLVAKTEVSFLLLYS